MFVLQDIGLNTEYVKKIFKTIEVSVNVISNWMSNRYIHCAIDTDSNHYVCLYQNSKVIKWAL